MACLAALKELTHTIDSVWLVTENPIIRMGAAVMAMFVKFRMHVVAREEDIH